jgi:hypothetical protein
MYMGHCLRGVGRKWERQERILRGEEDGSTLHIYI